MLLVANFLTEPPQDYGADFWTEPPQSYGVNHGEDAFLVFNLGIWLVFGIACAVIAPGRGRSPVAWFFIGVLGNCFGLIVLLVIPNLKLEEANKKKQARENRRLREQIAKERQVADHRHRSIERRVSAHDQALDLDTSSDSTAIERSSEVPPLPADTTQWYYASGRERIGPVSAADIRDLISAGSLESSTLVWCSDMDGWEPLADVPDFEDHQA